MKENTSYARISNKTKEEFITESNNRYKCNVSKETEKHFIIGHLGRFSGKQIFPIEKSNQNNEKSNYQSKSKKLRVHDLCISQTIQTDGFGATVINENSEITENETISIHKERNEKLIARGFNRKEGLKDELDIAHSLQSSDMGLNRNQNQNCIVHSLQPRSPNRPSLKYSSSGSGHLVRKDDKTFCLDSGNSQAVELISEKSRIRRLTPIECERLQGFPDNWTEGVSDTQRYRQLGNAVTVNVIEAIAKVIKNKYH